jgi:hypothetical protein
MRPVATTCLFLSLTLSASASRHEVRVLVVSTLSQHVGGVTVGIGPAGGPAGGEFASSTTTCAQPYPETTIAVLPGETPGATEHCILAGPSGDAIGTVQNRRVEAILTTDDGQTYYAVLGCQKQYGWCTPLTGQATYVGMLNDNPKRLTDYQHRPALGFMKVSLQPDGEKKVTYQIEYATQVKLIKRSRQ